MIGIHIQLVAITVGIVGIVAITVGIVGIIYYLDKILDELKKGKI